MLAAEQVEDMRHRKIDIKGVEESQNVKGEAWGSFCHAIGTDPESMKSVDRASFTRGLINLAFLVVLTGCELDLYGFGMAFTDYWALQERFVQFLLVCGPTSYLLACLLYLVFHNDVEARRRAEEESGRQGAQPQGVQLHYLSQSRASSSQTPQPARPVKTAKEPVKLQFYHFLPLFRYYLVVKEKETDDVESLFRVNSLSSFSLGIPQICGIIFSGLANNWELNIFVCINIASQVINWSITALYFLTPVSKRMGNSIRIEAMTYNTELRLKRLWAEYLGVAQQDSENNTSNTRVALEQFKSNIDREILTLANTSHIDLKPFDMESKFTALKYLYRRQNFVFAQI